jgi:hypothetical protein
MFSSLTSSYFIFLVMTLAAVALYVWTKRQLRKTSVETWKTLHEACTTSARKTAEAGWITALRASVAGDEWKPGLKPSASKVQIHSHPCSCDVLGHTEITTRRAASAENVAWAQPHLPSRGASEPSESTARQAADPEIVWLHCKPGDPNIAKLRRWISEGKTLFTVIVFPPADHEWEKIHEGQGLLEEVTGQEAKFRFNGAKPCTVFPDFNVGYDRKRKRPLIQFRERL